VRQQTIRYTATGVLGVLLAVALTVMVNWIAARHWVRADWTSSQVYTLSETTTNILRDLDQDIRVIVFMTPVSPLYEQVNELLQRYAAISDKVELEYIDPDREPLRTGQLAEQFGIEMADTVVFSYDDRNKYVTSDQMAELDYQGLQMGQAPSIQAFKGEEEFTAAILSLVAPGVQKVVFVTGHGEATPSSNQISGKALRLLEEAIRRENMEVGETSLLSGLIPEDADLLAVIGPTAAYTEAEVALLEGYLEGGGRLLVALDPLIDRDGTMRSTRLEDLLERFGAKVADDLVIDPTRRLPFFDLSAVYLSDFRSHPVTRSLEGMAVLLPVTRSVEAVEGDGFDSRVLVETSSEGRGETDLFALATGAAVEEDEADLAGPVAVAVAVEGSADAAPSPFAGETPTDADQQDGGPLEGFRLVVFGDSDFLTDGQVSNAGNLVLALNAFKWLAQREESLGIPPRQVEQVSLYLSQDQLGTILLVTLVVMPGAAIVLGIIAWRRRRH